MKDKKIVVLNSGGFDSIVLLNYMVKILEFDPSNITSLHINYGAPNEEQQLRCVNKVCTKLGITNKIIEIPPITWTKGDFYNKKSEITSKNLYVEYRNLILGSYAISYAESVGASIIALALINNPGYPDCSVTFVEGLNYIIEKSNMTIYTPFLWDSKFRLGHIAKYIGIKDSDYFSCDSPKENGEPCGVCEDCLALKEIKDKI